MLRGSHQDPTMLEVQVMHTTDTLSPTVDRYQAPEECHYMSQSSIAMFSCQAVYYT